MLGLHFTCILKFTWKNLATCLLWPPTFPNLKERPCVLFPRTSLWDSHYFPSLLKDQATEDLSGLTAFNLGRYSIYNIGFRAERTDVLTGYVIIMIETNIFWSRTPGRHHDRFIVYMGHIWCGFNFTGSTTISIENHYSRKSLKCIQSNSMEASRSKPSNLCPCYNFCNIKWISRWGRQETESDV